jgi:hypothetical protein
MENDTPTTTTKDPTETSKEGVAVADDLLYAETALASIGIHVDEDMSKENSSILSILRRKIKVCTNPNIFRNLIDQYLLHLLDVYSNYCEEKCQSYHIQSCPWS